MSILSNQYTRLGRRPKTMCQIGGQKEGKPIFKLVGEAKPVS
jgi:hypothetical protein